MIKRFAIVKLRKACYHYTDTDFKCDLLVLRSVDSPVNGTNHYIVRYPNGHTQMVSEEDIIPSSVVELASPSYFTRHTNNPVVAWELEHNPKFHNTLMQYVPNSPYFNAKKSEIKEYENTEACTTTISVPEITVAQDTSKPEPDTLTLILEELRAIHTLLSKE